MTTDMISWDSRRLAIAIPLMLESCLGQEEKLFNITVNLPWFIVDAANISEAGAA